MDPMAVHGKIVAISSEVSAGIAGLRRSHHGSSKAQAHAWEAVFDSLTAAQSVLTMLALMEIDAPQAPSGTASE
jgi:hypothetical protein